MKGLVTTISALALAAGVASAEGVTSANTVGFQEIQSSSFQLVTPSFAKVDGTTLTLGELVPAADWDPGSDKILCYTGPLKDYEATYLNAELLAELAVDFPNLAGLSAGWYDYAQINALDEDTILTCYNTRQIGFGTSGFAIQCSTPIRFVGEVKQVATPIQSGSFKLVGNCSPVDRTLADFVPAEGWDPGSDKILCYTGPLKDYEATYLDAELLAELAVDFPNLVGLSAGWYDYAQINALDEDTVLTCYNTRPVPAGSGFAIQCSAAINVPAATAN